ncbi:hypothetical protein IX329_000380 [Fusobacterium necrophorum]|nr:hypothetical protein [Fusobacterium necrophorum]MBR8788986.1 hypothetical protein [Fusobacterium necrophorum]MBR8823050.1 hypothetical protein [Fusobacterium necrophorum]
MKRIGIIRLYLYLLAVCWLFPISNRLFIQIFLTDTIE